jgi:hypothetical protein
VGGVQGECATERLLLSVDDRRHGQVLMAAGPNEQEFMRQGHGINA